MSNEIVEIIGDICRKVSQDCTLAVYNARFGDFERVPCPEINYIFGNGMYIKEQLDNLTLGTMANRKFPLIALFCPFRETRNTDKHYTAAKINLLIATSSKSDWSNEMRLHTSFEGVLRPVYNSLIKALKEDRRLEFGCRDVVKHEYSENYTYGKYGAYTGNENDKLSDPIDAINITNLEITVKNKTCR